MGEIIPGSFDKKKDSQAPQSPFKKETVIRARFGEPLFSKNGVVEYTRGIKPKDDVDVLDRVTFHVNPMERTILLIYPKLKGFKMTPEMQSDLDNYSEMDLVKIFEDSDLGDWTEHEEQAWGYLALIHEVRRRDLDSEED